MLGAILENLTFVVERGVIVMDQELSHRVRVGAMICPDVGKKGCVVYRKL